MGDRFSRAWQGFEEKVEAAKKKAGSDRLKERLDTELGIFLIKNVGTLFYFDPRIREYEREIKQLARNGKKEEAIMVASDMQGYILYQKEHSRRYKARLKKLGKQLEERSEFFEKRMEQVQGSRLAKWVEKLNTKDKEEFEELIEEGGGTSGGG